MFRKSREIQRFVQTPFSSSFQDTEYSFWVVNNGHIVVLIWRTLCKKILPKYAEQSLIGSKHTFFSRSSKQKARTFLHRATCYLARPTVPDFRWAANDTCLRLGTFLRLFSVGRRIEHSFFGARLKRWRFGLSAHPLRECFCKFPPTKIWVVSNVLFYFFEYGTGGHLTLK